MWQNEYSPIDSFAGALRSHIIQASRPSDVMPAADGRGALHTGREVCREFDRLDRAGKVPSIPEDLAAILSGQREGTHAEKSRLSGIIAARAAIMRDIVERLETPHTCEHIHLASRPLATVSHLEGHRRCAGARVKG